MTMRSGGPVVDARVWMRAALVIAVIVPMLAMLARAEAQTSLPEIIVRPPQPPPRISDDLDRKDDGGSKGGSGVKGGDGRSLEQLNQQLKRKVDETNPVVNTPPLDARSPDTKTGVVNIPGVQQQYGKNFGNSVIPYRPSITPTPPLGHR